MSPQRAHILRMLYDERQRSPLQTLGVDEIMRALGASRTDVWNHLEYLQEKGYLTISERQVSTSVFHSFKLTALGVDVAEHALSSVMSHPGVSQDDSQESAPRIFVSHASQDVEFCVRLRHYLQERYPTADIFFDADQLRAGDNWMEIIERQLVARPIFIVVLSPHAVASAWVKRETQLALLDDTRRVIPVLYRPCDIDALSSFLKLHQAIDCTQGNEVAGISVLLAALQR